MADPDPSVRLEATSSARTRSGSRTRGCEEVARLSVATVRSVAHRTVFRPSVAWQGTLDTRSKFRRLFVKRTTQCNTQYCLGASVLHAGRSRAPEMWQYVSHLSIEMIRDGGGRMWRSIRCKLYSLRGRGLGTVRTLTK